MYRSKRIAAIVVARFGSHRLPGKMLLPFGEGTVLSSVLQRLRACCSLDEIILATTESGADDPIVSLGNEFGLRVVRGDEHDLVARMQKAVRELDEVPDIIVRGCADNPLVMPSVVDEGICALIDNAVDLLTPFEYATYPFGFGLVAMTRACLDRIDAGARDPIYREHVENYCFEHPEEFSIHYQLSPPGQEHPEIIATLDYDVDYERLVIFESLLRDVPLAKQPRVLVDHIRNARVWVEGRDGGTPSGHDLVLATRSPDVRAPRGVVVVDLFDCGDEQRYGLRYADKSPWATRRPLFLDARDNTARDTPLEFLTRVADYCLPALLAGPLRQMTSPDGKDPGLDKSARPENRQGFRHPSDESFPAEVVLDLATSLSGNELVGKLLEELERHPSSRLIVTPESSKHVSSITELAKRRLGQERVNCTTAPAASSPDVFRRVVVDGAGRLILGDVQAPVSFEGCSIAKFWRSGSARRLRAETLNAGSTP